MKSKGPSDITPFASKDSSSHDDPNSQPNAKGTSIMSLVSIFEKVSWLILIHDKNYLLLVFYQC